MAPTITVDLNNVTRHVPAEFNGVHYSPLNNQLRFVYSELVEDESFEQAVAGRGDLYMPDFNASRGWHNRTKGGAAGETHALLIDQQPPAFSASIGPESTVVPSWNSPPHGVKSDMRAVWSPPAAAETVALSSRGMSELLQT